MRGHAVLTSSASDEWSTPLDFFSVVDREFDFTLDAAARAENALVSRFISAEQDALVTDWGTGELVWLNPPYSLVGEFMDRAADMGQLNTVACLVPARTDTKWWHRSTSRADEVRLIRGRLRFGGGKNSAPFPSALVVFRPDPIAGGCIYNWDWKA